ncbi:membrane dipeptidase [[Clostridium] innocuum]|nr:membrane dipeptidase [[Clostridium] innocuum]
MKLFDLHADIGYDVMQKKNKESDILNRFHVQKFLAGEVSYVGMASFFEGSEPWEYMQDMILSLKREIESCDQIDLVVSKEDLKENGHIKAVLTVEGMCGIKDHAAEKIRWMYEQGVRIASFCWNEENMLATGVKGNPAHGLHPLGQEALQTMIDCNMLVDVSHANEKTFWDILAQPQALVIATHSNARAICDHPRNLWDEQIQAIVKRGGIIGINSAPAFVHPDPAKRDIAHLVEHMRYIQKLAGIEALALGLDYMDFYEGCEELHTIGLDDCSKSQRLIAEMKRQHFKEEEIQKIAFGNAVEKLKEVL